MNKKEKRVGAQRFYELLEEIADLHERKNQNYATAEDPLSNLKASEKFNIPAWKGTLIRITDKYCRIVELANGKTDLVGESMMDTLQDMAVYALLCIVLLEEANGKTTTNNGIRATRKGPNSPHS